MSSRSHSYDLDMFGPINKKRISLRERSIWLHYAISEKARQRSETAESCAIRMWLVEFVHLLRNERHSFLVCTQTGMSSPMGTKQVLDLQARFPSIQGWYMEYSLSTSQTGVARAPLFS